MEHLALDPTWVKNHACYEKLRAYGAIAAWFLSGPLIRNSHILSDLVVDRWAADVEGSSHVDFLFQNDVSTVFGRLIGDKITPIMSISWDFTTKSGGIWGSLPSPFVPGMLYTITRYRDTTEIFQIPSDLVARYQAIDIVGVIFSFI